MYFAFEWLGYLFVWVAALEIEVMLVIDGDGLRYLSEDSTILLSFLETSMKCQILLMLR